VAAGGHHDGGRRAEEEVAHTIATNRGGGVADLRGAPGGPAGGSRRATGVLLLVTGALAGAAPAFGLVRYGPVVFLFLVYLPVWGWPALPGLVMTVTAGCRIVRGDEVEGMGLAGALCLLPMTAELATFGGPFGVFYVLATASALASVCACGYELAERRAREQALRAGRHRLKGPG
jgi:hypothetical protein